HESTTVYSGFLSPSRSPSTTSVTDSVIPSFVAPPFFTRTEPPPRQPGLYVKFWKSGFASARPPTRRMETTATARTIPRIIRALGLRGWFGEQLLHRCHEQLRLQRLDEPGLRAEHLRLLNELGAALRRQHHERNRTLILPHGVEELDATHARHRDVAHDHL